jgi:hypothetical protein
MKRIALLFVVVVGWGLVAAPLRAQINPGTEPELLGHYTVTGANAEGDAYTGAVEISAMPGSRFLVQWTFAGPDGETAMVTGIGVSLHGNVSVAYITPTRVGLMPSIVVYSVEKGDPLTLSGQWTTPLADGILTETLVKLPKGHPAPSVQPKRKKPPEGQTQASNRSARRGRLS